jgi:glycine/D-amino acid oxidase-like deaminating enzyme
VPSMVASVAVVGAGIVGVACALELQRRGRSVTLLDRGEPGGEASYGNSGLLARSSLVPFNHPGIWSSLPKLLENQSTRFRYDPAFLLRNPAWVARFLASARPAAFEATKAALDSLIVLSIAEHKRLLAEAGIAHRLRTTGWLFLYRSATSFASGRIARVAYHQFGVATQLLDRAALRELEPGLTGVFDRALWIRDAASVDNPGAVVQAYAKLLVDRGGTLLKRKVADLRRRPSGWAVLDAAGGHIDADEVVLALGAWSKGFLAKMGIAVPMAFERGYHMHFAPAPQVALQRPIYDVDGGYVLTPMERGLRLTTGIELADLDAPKNLEQLRSAETAAREAFPLGERLDGEAWMGARPTLPDSRPMIGPCAGHPGLWLAFGHQHIGFSTGPGTAALLGDLIAGATPRINPYAFRPGRFMV